MRDVGKSNCQRIQPRKPCTSLGLAQQRFACVCGLGPGAPVSALKTGVPSAPDLCTGAKSPCRQGMAGPSQDATLKIIKASTSLPCREDDQGGRDELTKYKTPACSLAGMTTEAPGKLPCRDEDSRPRQAPCRDDGPGHLWATALATVPPPPKCQRIPHAPTQRPGVETPGYVYR